MTPQAALVLLSFESEAHLADAAEGVLKLTGMAAVRSGFALLAGLFAPRLRDKIAV